MLILRNLVQRLDHEQLYVCCVIAKRSELRRVGKSNTLPDAQHEINAMQNGNDLIVAAFLANEVETNSIFCACFLSQAHTYVDDPDVSDEHKKIWRDIVVAIHNMSQSENAPIPAHDLAEHWCSPGDYTDTKNVGEKIDTYLEGLNKNIVLIVTDDNRVPIGIVTDKDLGKASDDTVRSLMSSPVETRLTKTHMREIYQRLYESKNGEIKIHHMVIVDSDGRLSGVVTMTEAHQWFKLQKPN